MRSSVTLIILMIAIFFYWQKESHEKKSIDQANTIEIAQERLKKAKISIDSIENVKKEQLETQQKACKTALKRAYDAGFDDGILKLEDSVRQIKSRYTSRYNRLKEAYKKYKQKNPSVSHDTSRGQVKPSQHQTSVISQQFSYLLLIIITPSLIWLLIKRLIVSKHKRAKWVI